MAGDYRSRCIESGGRAECDGVQAQEHCIVRLLRGVGLVDLSAIGPRDAGKDEKRR